MFTHKNLMTVCCAAVLAFGLAACGSSDDGMLAVTDSTCTVTDDTGDTDATPSAGMCGRPPGGADAIRTIPMRLREAVSTRPMVVALTDAPPLSDANTAGAAEMTAGSYRRRARRPPLHAANESTPENGGRCGPGCHRCGEGVARRDGEPVRSTLRRPSRAGSTSWRAASTAD